MNYCFPSMCYWYLFFPFNYLLIHSSLNLIFFFQLSISWSVGHASCGPARSCTLQACNSIPMEPFPKFSLVKLQALFQRLMVKLQILFQTFLVNVTPFSKGFVGLTVNPFPKVLGEAFSQRLWCRLVPKAFSKAFAIAVGLFQSLPASYISRKLSTA